MVVYWKVSVIGFCYLSYVIFVCCVVIKIMGFKENFNLVEIGYCII